MISNKIIIYSVSVLRSLYFVLTKPILFPTFISFHKISATISSLKRYCLNETMCLFTVSQLRSRSRPRYECPIPVVILPPPRPVHILHDEHPSPHTQRPDGHYWSCPTPCEGSHGPRALMPRNIGYDGRPRFRGDTRGRRIEESRGAEWNQMQQRDIRRPEPAYFGGHHMVESGGALDVNPHFRQGDDDRSSIGHSTESSYAAPSYQHHRGGPPYDDYYQHNSPNDYPGPPHPSYHDRLPPDYYADSSTSGYPGLRHRSFREPYPPEYSLERTANVQFGYRYA